MILSNQKADSFYIILYCCLDYNFHPVIRYGEIVPGAADHLIIQHPAIVGEMVEDKPG